jgi:BirA family biotin operon repressor/biotin-[acetyl-CoA-carboxylase] ligase
MPFSVVAYSQLDSTNAEAFRLISRGEAFEGLVLQAEEQTHGRGAGQNLWESKAGKNLTFSIILKPSFIKPSQQFVLTEMISLTLFDVVQRRLEESDLSVKWPNDLYFKDKKLAGILIQNRIKGTRIDFSVIGVGLNVNQKVFHSDAPNPASLIHFTQKEENLAALLKEILARLQFYYEKLPSDINALKADYSRRLYRMNQWATYEDAFGRFQARLTGVDAFGRLLLTDQQGSLRIYGFKEVSFLQ